MKNFLKIICVGLVVLATLIWLSGRGWFGSTENQLTNQNKLRIITSFYPLYYFATQIGQDFVLVTNLTPAGAEPHDFEPNAQTLAEMENSQLVLANGAGFEPWLSRLETIQGVEKTRVLAVADELAVLKFTENGVEVVDPHVWLDPVLAAKEVEIITQAMIAADPVNQAHYAVNGKLLNERLINLDTEFEQGLSKCEHRKIVTSHEAFGYLAKRYDLKHFSIVGLAPDQEPTPVKMAEIIDLVKSEGIKYIFFETLVSPRIAETIAVETGAKTLVFNPLEGISLEEQQAGEDYFSVQRLNLINLRTALNCQ